MIAKLLHNLALKFGYDEDARCRACWRSPSWLRYPRQQSTKTATALEIATVIHETEGIGRVLFHNSDTKYKLVDVEHFKGFLKGNTVSNRSYHPEDHDCDNFSKELLGDVSKWDPSLAFGEIWMRDPSGQSHALNWLMGTDMKLYLCEPQEDRIFKPTDLWFTYWLRL